MRDQQNIGACEPFKTGQVLAVFHGVLACKALVGVVDDLCEVDTLLQEPLNALTRGGSSLPVDSSPYLAVNALEI